MAYSDPQSTSNPTTGQPILAAWGDVVRDDLEYLARNKPHCDAYSTAVQSIANNTFVALLFPSETHDVGGLHSTASNTDRFTIPSGESGKYDISCGGNFAGNATGARNIYIQKNGSDLTPARGDGQTPSASFATYLSIAVFAVPLVAGDIIRMVVYQNSGGALNFDDYWLSIKWTAL